METNENLPHSTENSTQCSVVTKMEGNPKKWGYTSTHSWFSLLDSRNWNNTVKRLYSNKNQFQKLKKINKIAEGEFTGKTLPYQPNYEEGIHGAKPQK